jgi:hypothetical protein
MPSPTVYLLVQPTVSRAGETPDLKPLSAFGEVVVLVQAGDNPLHRSVHTLDNIKKRLEHFDPKADFLTAAGGGAIAALMVGVAISDLGFDQFVWLSAQRAKDAQGRRTNVVERYIPVRVDLGQLALDIDAPHINEGGST